MVGRSMPLMSCGAETGKSPHFSYLSRRQHRCRSSCPPRAHP
ncbi:hypothetical protein LINPERPRIM_LOCUS24510 [Linum perenne]